MPLDAEGGPLVEVVPLDGFDDTVVGPRDGAASRAGAVDRLVVQRAHVRGARRAGRAQPEPGSVEIGCRPSGRMCGRCGPRSGAACRRRPPRRPGLHGRRRGSAGAAPGPAARGRSRPGRARGRRAYAADRATVERRVQVSAAGEHEPVEDVQDVVPGARREEHGSSSRGGHLRDVRPRDAVHRQVAPRPRDDVRRTGDPDERTPTGHQVAATTAVTARARPVR